MKQFIAAKGINTEIIRLVLSDGCINAEVVRPQVLGEVKNLDLKPLRSETLMQVPQDVLPELVGESERSARADAFLAKAWQKAVVWVKA